MNMLAHTLRRAIPRRWPRSAAATAGPVEQLQLVTEPPVELAPTDPLLGYLLRAGGAVELDALTLESSGLAELRATGVKLVVPLVAHGELIGVLNLGPRLSEQDYSSDDCRLLEHLATQAAPAVRVAQLVREQQAEALARERIAQELRVAHLIQQHFLPNELPQLPGWEVAAYYQPAREVGGDFYDFIALAGGMLGIVIGDVTDKGVPAAMVMAAARSLLRAESQRRASPGAVLEQVNDLLCPTMPPNMFVTCLYAVLDPTSGRLRYANAGHDTPYVRTAEGGAIEMRARGMPLGLMAGMTYEENELCLAPGEHVLFHSDGLAEAHNPRREMFGFPRVKELVGSQAGSAELINVLLAELERFTGPGWQQEDDVTLVTLRRAPATTASASSTADCEATSTTLLAEFSLPSQPGTEREAIDRVARAVEGLNLPAAQIERLKTAVGEATMNAIEHGNNNRPELPVAVQVLVIDGRLHVRITDLGGGTPIPEAATPDLDAKLAGVQTPRGWGLFLIKNMVDEMQVHGDAVHHTIDLVLHLEGDRR
jgi:serine phosphatase RsbU (regulator of sigma subunit)/anti-sigma regulatory factor (Ser/Thr protein kinase)